MYKTVLTLALIMAFHAQANQWHSKVSNQVLERLNLQDEVELILKLKSPTLQLQKASNRVDKIKNKVAQLKQQATMSQQPVLTFLQNQGIAHQAYWVSNLIWVKANKNQVAQILSMDVISQAYLNDRISLKLPINRGPRPKSPNAIEWNVNMVNAPDVWDLGYLGQNIVVGGQDTGYAWDHPALINKYRGWDGQNADHNYNWHDSTTSPSVDCGGEPCDDHSHGTHTMGTVLGDDGNDNQIGVAPDARWMACRNMDLGNGTPATYTECFQWFLEPTDLNGLNPDSAMAPHIINNSWGCPISEGCSDPAVLIDVVNNVVDAGILVVASAGNSGSGCHTITMPIATYDKSFTIGSTNTSDSISGFSSRGSINVDGSNRQKPDLTAPGSSVRSANNASGYSTFNGTSMAAPNVSGVAALVLSAKPELAGNPELIQYILTSTAVPKTTTQSCGGIAGSVVPNNTYGYGRVDALAAVNYALDLIYRDDF